MIASESRSSERDTLDRVAAAVGTVTGLSLQVPLRAQALRWAGRAAALAITLDQEGVEVRLVARRSPLPPLLDQADAAVRAALTGTDWEEATLRFIVTEIAAEAFTQT